MNATVHAASEEEVQRLRALVRDLTAMSALPLVWVGREAPVVVDSFLDMLLATLRLDLVYGRLTHPAGGPQIEAARAAGAPRLACGGGDAIGRALEPHLASVGVATVDNPVSQGDPVSQGKLRLSVASVDTAQNGIIAAASHRADFPTASERALLSAAVNQVAMWFQVAHLAFERARAAAELAERERLQRRLEEENAFLREEMETAQYPGGIIGHSPALRDVLAQLALVAQTEATVLILGESGTGKELIAREIHQRSARADQPLVKVNCSAIPREMFESEFFGHVKGAFTGALCNRPGRFQLADGGSIFLDEIGDLPLDLQPKLLRVLQEGQFEPIGDDTTHAVNVRVIAATNRDLQAEGAAGRFRQDLLYRLSVFPLLIELNRYRGGSPR